MDLFSVIVYSIILVLGTAVTIVTSFLIFAPSQYAPYRTDLVVEEEVSAQEVVNEAGEGYAHFKPRDTKKKLRSETSVQIVVLGDIGRSPRMQYHAISLARRGARVDLIGFQDSEIHPDLQAEPLVKIVPLASPPSILQTRNTTAFVLLGPIKVIWQAFSLFWVLGYNTAPAKWMLVQNPPSIPVLAIAKLICVCRNTKLIIDWHNFGWSILALKLGRHHPLVELSRLYERLFSGGADAHFCVSQAMSTVLAKTNKINALPLHDRPISTFQPLDSSQRFAFLGRLEQTAAHVDDIRSGKWKLLVTSTSWTADEDFPLLINALVSYSTKAASDKTLPYILAIITGKGPQKEHYLRQIQQLSQANKLSRATILSAWLSTNDYASLLGAADLGVSLHKSTSGVDLPMKIVDMFGAGLPVVSYSDYESWSELVKEGVNGRGFSNAHQLQSLLTELFGGQGSELETIREGVKWEGSKRWDDEWDAVAGRKVFRIEKPRVVLQQSAKRSSDDSMLHSIN